MLASAAALTVTNCLRLSICFDMFTLLFLSIDIIYYCIASAIVYALLFDLQQYF